MLGHIIMNYKSFLLIIKIGKSDLQFVFENTSQNLNSW